MDEVKAPEQGEQLQVISLVQLPVIEERLQSVKDDILKRTEAAKSLAVTEDTRTDVKKIRAEMNKEFGRLETQRKQIKAQIMAPYARFEAVYKECVSDPYNEADDELAEKINEVESALRDKKEAEVKDYFAEFAKATGVDWLTWEQLGVKTTLTASLKGLKAQVSTVCARVSRDCTAIETMTDRDEIMIEYKKSLDLGAACQIVRQRHEALEAQRKAAAEREARLQAQREATCAAQEAIAAEAAKQAAQEAAPAVEVTTAHDAENAPQGVPAANPAIAEEKRYKTRFEVVGTLAQLKALKTYMESEGLTYAVL